MAPSTRERLMVTIGRSWDDLLASVEGLTDEELLTTGVVERWSVKDILAHVTTWERESLEHLPSIARGDAQQRYSTVYGSLDAFNALKFEENQNRPLPEVRTRLHDTHQQLLAYLDSVPDELLSSKERFRTRLRWDTYSHYAIHAQHIREWRTTNCSAE